VMGAVDCTRSEVQVVSAPLLEVEGSLARDADVVDTWTYIAFAGLLTGVGVVLFVLSSDVALPWLPKTLGRSTPARLAMALLFVPVALALFAIVLGRARARANAVLFHDDVVLFRCDG